MPAVPLHHSPVPTVPLHACRSPASFPRTNRSPAPAVPCAPIRRIARLLRHSTSISIRPACHSRHHTLPPAGDCHHHSCPPPFRRPVHFRRAGTVPPIGGTMPCRPDTVQPIGSAIPNRCPIGQPHQAAPLPAPFRLGWSHARTPPVLPVPDSPVVVRAVVETDPQPCR